MHNMLSRVEFLDKLNANTQKRLESGRKTQILSDIDRLKAAAHGAVGEEKSRLEEGIAQLNSDLAKMRGVSTRGVAVTQAKTSVATQAKTPTVSVEVQTKGRAKAHKLSPKELKKARVRAKGLAFNPTLGRMERVHKDYLPHHTEFYDMSPKDPPKRRLKPIDKAATLPHNTLDAFARR